MTARYQFTLRLDRRLVSDGFYWHEIEDELKERNLHWNFVGNDDVALRQVLDKINELRQGELYRHKKCSQQCKDKGSSPLEQPQLTLVTN